MLTLLRRGGGGGAPERAGSGLLDDLTWTGSQAPCFSCELKIQLLATSKLPTMVIVRIV